MAVLGKDKYAGKEAFEAFMQIVYEALQNKTDSTTFEELVTRVAALEAVEGVLTVDDVINTFEGYVADTDANKVVAASLLKEIADKVSVVEGAQKDVIESWDDYNAAAVQLVAASLIKAIDEKIDALETKVDNFMATKGQAGGLATLNESGVIPSEQLPSYVDDVVDIYVVATTTGEGTTEEATTYQFFTDVEKTTELVPEEGKIYIDKETGDSWRWTGTQMANMSCPNFKEITADEVTAMWNSITIPEDTQVTPPATAS